MCRSCRARRSTWTSRVQRRRSTQRWAPAGGGRVDLHPGRCQDPCHRARLILAQDLCAVCAIDRARCEDALGVIGCHAEVVSLDPAGLDDVIDCVVQVGRATGHRGRCRCIRRRAPSATSMRYGYASPIWRGRGSLSSNGRTRRSTAGHWMPEMVEAAGRRTRPGRAPGAVPPPHVGGDRRRVDRRHDLHPLRFRPCRCHRAGRLVPAPAGSPRPRATSSRSTPTPTSPAPVHAWWTASSCSSRCCTRPGRALPFRMRRSWRKAGTASRSSSVWWWGSSQELGEAPGVIVGEDGTQHRVGGREVCRSDPFDHGAVEVLNHRAHRVGVDVALPGSARRSPDACPPRPWRGSQSRAARGRPLPCARPGV